MLKQHLISDKVKSQFPDFYHEYGESFIDFISEYYKWIEDNKYTGKTRDLLSILDIDKTSSEFLQFFKSQYMHTIPNDILGNQVLLQKHILDLYRSKGSYQGFRLLFRLLYNKDIQIYIPGKDVFKASDGKWFKRYYIEVDDRDINPTFEQKEIIGEFSGAKAIVETFEKIIYNGKKNCLLFISNIKGEFLLGERIYNDFSRISSCPKILGSMTSLDIDYSFGEFKKGDILKDENNPDIKFIVTETEPVGLSGVIIPRILNKGSGYRKDFTNLLVEKTSNTHPGSNADFDIVISNQGIISLTNEIIAPYANTTLDAVDFEMSDIITTNINTPLEDAFDFIDYQYGFIDDIIINNPGKDYEQPLKIIATDQEMSRLELYDSNGLLGNNSIIEGNPSFSDISVKSSVPIKSLFNFSKNDIITLREGDNIVRGIPIITPIGYYEGYFKTSDSFVSDKKYLQDSYYYQEYSYDIKIDETFDKYFDILKKTVHVTGRKAFGNFRLNHQQTMTYDVNINIKQNS